MTDAINQLPVMRKNLPTGVSNNEPFGQDPLAAGNGR